MKKSPMDIMGLKIIGINLLSLNGFDLLSAILHIVKKAVILIVAPNIIRNYLQASY